MFPSPWLAQAGTSAEQAGNRRKRDVLAFFGQGGSATKISAKTLTRHGFEKESHGSGGRVLLTGPPSGYAAGVLSVTGADLGYRPTPLAAGGRGGAVSLGSSPARLRGRTPYGAPNPSSVNRHFWRGKRSIESPCRQMAFWGGVCKLET